MGNDSVNSIAYSIKKQKPMRAMLIGLVPVTVMSVYFFGWRSLALVLFCCLIAYLTEIVFETFRKATPTESILVSGVLFGLSLPPFVPMWIAAVGMVFGVVFGKQVFGGFGRNVFNPAIVGRCFVYVCFPFHMTSQWMLAGSWPWGRLDSYSAVDAITSATPLSTFKITGDVPNFQDLFWGNIAGSVGETCAPAILLGAAYILYTKAADWRYPLSCLLGAAGLNTVFYVLGVRGVMDPIRNILAGSLLFATFFMVTEPVSGCVKLRARWFYGILIGSLWIFIRSFSGFPEATAFAILLGNTFGPLIDEAVIGLEQRKKARVVVRSGYEVS